MKKIVLSAFALLLLLSGCSPVKLPVSNQYQLTAFSSKHYTKTASHRSILVTAPTATSEYQTEQMLYVQKPYKLSAFANNAWASTPPEMLYPLIVQSLQHSGYFNAVASTPYAQETDYRLDTQVLKIQQNFLRKPSVLELSVKVVVSRVNGNHVLGSKVFTIVTPCPQESPYGGVIAANQATLKLTDAITHFAVSIV